MIEVMDEGKRVSIPFGRIIYYQETDRGTLFYVEGGSWIASTTPYGEVCAMVDALFSRLEDGEDD